MEIEIRVYHRSTWSGRQDKRFSWGKWHIGYEVKNEDELMLG